MKRRYNIPMWRSAVVVVLVGGTIALCLGVQPVEQGDDAGVNLDLPVILLHYAGEKGAVSEAEKQILPADTEFAKMSYHGLSKDGARENINCTIVLSANDRRSLHRPEVCLPGQGWSIDTSEIVPVELDSETTLKVRRLGLSQEREVAKDRKVLLRAQYLYWYVGKDVTTPSTLDRVLLTARDNVFRNLNHRWAYVSVMSLVTEGLQPNGKDDEETTEMLGEFIRAAVPKFQKTF